MNLWSTRAQSERALTDALKPLADLLDETFNMLDESMERLDALQNPFGRVTALVLIKGRNLALGCYSLSLDALAQEGGALFRPLIETVELLTYFQLDPARIDEALNDRLPKAGDRPAYWWGSPESPQPPEHSRIPSVRQRAFHAAPDRSERGAAEAGSAIQGTGPPREP